MNGDAAASLAPGEVTLDGDNTLEGVCAEVVLGGRLETVKRDRL
jgi:hypothetical protein